MMIEKNYIKITNSYMNNKIISENLFQVRDNLTDDEILKFYSIITSIINIRIGKNKNKFSKTSVDIVKIKNFNLK